MAVRALSIMDAFHYLAKLRYIGSIFVNFSNILVDCAGVKLNLSESSLNVLQVATIVDPAAAMSLIMRTSPFLRSFPWPLMDFSVWDPVGSTGYSCRPEALVFP